MDNNRLKQYADKVKAEARGLDRKLIARVAGVTFEGRQEVLAKMDENTSVMLERDRRNEYDFFAVKVLAEVEDELQQVGFLPRDMAKLVSKSLDSGISIVSSVHRIKGGMEREDTGEKLFLGLEISVAPE